jgi:hypothetical protein
LTSNAPSGCRWSPRSPLNASPWIANLPNDDRKGCWDTKMEATGGLFWKRSGAQDERRSLRIFLSGSPMLR